MLAAQCRATRTWRLSEAVLAGHSGEIAERDLRTQTGEAGGNPEAGWRRGAKAWHPDAPRIIHLIQFALGMMDEGARNLPPIFADVDQQRRQWRWRVARLVCVAPLRQRRARSSNGRPTS